MRIFAVIFSLFFLTLTVSNGKAYFYNRSELVSKSEVIAIIELEAPVANDDSNPFAVPKYQWSYRQKTKARVIRKLKGEIPDDFILFGGEIYICAQCSLTQGRFLAFLVRDGDRWVGTNWHLSLRPIINGKIEWYQSAEKDRAMGFQQEKAVLADVRALNGAK